MACSSHKHHSPPPPPTVSTAQQEANKLNSKTITLNDTSSTTYENKTAEADVQAIDTVIEAAGYLNTTQVKDFSFNNTTNLKATTNSGIGFNVTAPDKSTAKGTFNIVINPYKPTPPTVSTAQQEANKLNSKTIILNDTAFITYEEQTAQQDVTAIDNAITTAGYLNATQVKDLSFDKTKTLSTDTNSGIGFNVTAPDKSKAKGTFNIVIDPAIKPEATSLSPSDPKESTITPSTPTTAKKESDQVNNKSITLNDTASTKYEDKTAQQDVTAIDNAITTAGYLNPIQVKDLSFDNTKNLTTGTNSGVGFNVTAPDKSTAKGTFNIVINPYKPTPPTPGTGGLGMSKSVPYLDIDAAASGVNGLTPQKVYNTFGVHQVMVSFANAFDKTGAA